MAPNNSFVCHLASFVDVEAAHQNGQDQNTYMDDVLATMQTYIMELDAESSVGRLPQCFTREFGDVIASQLMLRDPNRNEFEVRVTKKSGELYFDDGWSTLKAVYKLLLGAWVAFTYVNPSLLTIRITTRCGSEVMYPTHDPPLKCLLVRAESNDALDSSASLNRHVSHRTYVRNYFKQITFYDLYSGTLILPWYGFGEHVFEFVFSDLVLIDTTSKRYPCKLRFGVDPVGQLACKVTGNGWTNLCTDRGISIGDKVIVSVMSPAHNYEMYVAFYLPMDLH